MPPITLPQLGAPFVDPKTGVLSTVGSNIILNLLNMFQAQVGTFADLPTPAVTGMLRVVNDSNTAVWGATIAAGGANVVLGFYDGTNWTVAAK